MQLVDIFVSVSWSVCKTADGFRAILRCNSSCYTTYVSGIICKYFILRTAMTISTNVFGTLVIQTVSSFVRLDTFTASAEEFAKAARVSISATVMILRYAILSSERSDSDILLRNFFDFNESYALVNRKPFCAPSTGYLPQF